MNNKMKHVIIIAMIFVITNVHSLVFTNGAAVLKKNITVYNTPNPTINGVLENDEWINAEPYTMALYGYGKTSTTKDIELMFLYNDTTKSLYVGATIQDTNATGDYFLIVFRTNESSTMILGSTPESMRFGNGNDLKVGFVSNNETLDAYTIDTGVDAVKDIDAGGTEDFIGKVHDYGTYITFEWCIDYDSGDTNGRDLNLRPSITANFFALYHDVDNDLIYSQIRTVDASYDYCQITLSTSSSPKAGFSMPWLFTTFSASLLMIVIIIKSRKAR